MTSIEDFDANSPTAQIESPASVEAMRRLGFELTDLLFQPKEEFAKTVMHTERLDQRYAAYEHRRLQRVEEVKLLRRKLKSPHMSPLQKSTNSARNSPPTPTRLKPIEEREKHYLEVLKAKREAHLRQIAEAERYHQVRLKQHLLVTQEQSERERQRKREEYEKTKDLEALRQEHKSFLAEAHRTHQDLSFLKVKKEQLRAQLASLRSISSSDSIRKVAAEQLQELAKKVETQRQRLLSKKTVRSRLQDTESKSVFLTAKANLDQLLSSDSSVLRLSRHSKHMTDLEEKRLLTKRVKVQQRQERETRMLHRVEDQSYKLIQKKDELVHKDEAIRERVAHVRKTRESRLKALSEKERQRHMHSEQARQQQEEEFKAKLLEVDASLQQAVQKAERSLSHRDEENKRRKELNHLHRTDTLKNVQRIRKAESYMRDLALSRISEERTARLLQQEARNAQARQRQLLHKQLLSERHRIVQDFDRILNKKGPTFLFDEHVSELLNNSTESITLPKITPKKSPVPTIRSDQTQRVGEYPSILL